jgi:hypothetical protein
MNTAKTNAKRAREEGFSEPIVTQSAVLTAKTQTAALGRPSDAAEKLLSALTRFETRVALADHEHFAATPHDFAITVTRLGRLERGKNLHDAPSLMT